MADLKVKTPLRGRVLFRIDHVPIKQGLIYIPQATRRKLPFGVVVKLPPDYDGELEVGGRYLFDFKQGFRVDDDHIILNEEDLQAKVVKDE